MKLPSARVVREKLFEFLRFAALGVAVYLLAKQFVRHSSGPKEGSPAAAFDLPLVGTSGRVSLSAQQGKPVLMEVFASWCSACRKSTPRLIDAFRAHRTENVKFLAVSVDEDASAAKRVKSDWQIPFDVAIDDGSVLKGYAVSVLPTLIYIDGKGTVRHAAAGVASRSELDDWIDDR